MFHITVGDRGFLHPDLGENLFFKRVNGTVSRTEFENYCVKPGAPIEVKVLFLKPWTSNPWCSYSPFTREIIMLALSRSESEVYLPFTEELLKVGIPGKGDEITWGVMGKQFTPKRGIYV